MPSSARAVAPRADRSARGQRDSVIVDVKDTELAEVRDLLDGGADEREAALTALLRTHVRRAAVWAGELARLGDFASTATLDAFRTLTALSDDELPLIEAHKALGIRYARIGELEEAMRYLHSVGSNVEMTQRRHDARARRALRYFADPEIDRALAALAAHFTPVTAKPSAPTPKRLAIVVSGLLDDNAQATTALRLAEGFRDVGYELDLVSSEYGDSTASATLARAQSARFRREARAARGRFRERVDGVRAIFEAHPVHGALFMTTAADVIAKLVSAIGVAPVQFFGNTGHEPHCGKFDRIFQSVSEEQVTTTHWPGKSVYVGAFVALAPEIERAHAHERSALNVADDAVVLATFGRLLKCSNAYLAAVRRILVAAPDAVLLIAGPSIAPDVDAARAAVSAMGLNDRVRLLGPRQRERSVPCSRRSISISTRFLAPALRASSKRWPRALQSSRCAARATVRSILWAWAPPHRARKRSCPRPRSWRRRTTWTTTSASRSDTSAIPERRRNDGASLRAFVAERHSFEAFMRRIDGHVRAALG